MPRYRPTQGPGGGARAPRSDGSNGSHRGRSPGQEHRRRTAPVETFHSTGPTKAKSKAKARRRRVRRARRRRQESVTAPLTPRRLNREIAASLKLRYGPLLQTIAGDIRGSQYRQGTEIPAWFQHFQNAAAQAQAQSQAAFAGAQQAQLGAAQAGYGRTMEDINLRQAQAAQEATVRGQGADSTSFDQMRTAADFTRLAGQQAAGVTGTLGGIASTELGMAQLVGAAKMLEALTSERRREGSLREERRGVLRERGAAGIDLRRELRGDERQWQAIVQEFGLDQAQLAADIADDRADNRRQARQERRQARNDRAERARKKLLNRSTRLDIKRKKGELALDRTADIADDGRRNFSTNYSEWAQRTRPDKDGGKGSSGGKFKGSKTHVTPSERRQNQATFRSMLRRRRAGEPFTGSPDPLLMQAVAQYLYWEKRGAAGVTSPALQRKLWKEFGIRVPVSPGSGKRKGSRTTPGPGNQGPRPN